MIAVAALLAMAILPLDGTASDRCDAIELNHVYDATGNHVLSQLVFWEWRGDDLHVRAWRLHKGGERPLQRDGEWRAIVCECGGLIREIRAASFTESWTQYDVERLDRDRFPQESRRGLLFERKPEF